MLTTNLYYDLVKKKQILPLQNCYLSGLCGSSFAFFIKDVFLNAHQPFLIICNDKAEAAYLLNDLQDLLNNKQLLFLPESNTDFYLQEEFDNTAIQERTETLSNIIKENFNGIIITTPLGILEKVVSKKTLKTNTLFIKKGDQLDLLFVQDFLGTFLFEKVDFVLSPGQYAVRGGIIDVFSYAHEWPIRIEFFGNEVEQLRLFDPVTQISNQVFEYVTIIPNTYNEIEKEDRCSLFTYLLKHTSICFNNYASTINEINEQYTKAENNYQQSNSGTKKTPNNYWLSTTEFENDIADFNFIEYGKIASRADLKTIPFNQSPQPQFKKNFDFLIQNLNENKTKGYKNYISTKNIKQVERLQTIFKDILNCNDDTFTQLIEHSNIKIHEGFIDHDLKIAVYTDHQIFERYHQYQLKNTKQKVAQSLSLKDILALMPGDYVTHIDHGIGRFGGLTKISVQDNFQEAVKLVYKDNDTVFVSIHNLHKISKYAGKDGSIPRIDKVGSTTWATLKQKTKNKVKEVAFDLIKLYAKRKAQQGFRFMPDTYLQHELEASFIYEDTPDQIKVTHEVKRDMEKPYPMDRLVCGDVGFGKTEIAIRAAFKCINDSKQVAVLVPTTILAYQHYKTFSSRLKNLPCKVAYINRFKTTKEIKETVELLKQGKIDILIGTHKIISKEIQFKDLGLLIIDEEQKFGVNVKDKIKQMKTIVDTLTLTATPIPRTLQFSLMGARDLSIISTPPSNRFPVDTQLITLEEAKLKEIIEFELQRGGQLFFVHNKVQNITDIVHLINRIVPNANVGFGHGQMPGEELENVMLEFVHGNIDILVSTTIIESGIDISNANTIIINDAQNFGLSDLHQLRGRVGRSDKKAYCYLITPPLFTLTTEAKKRLNAIIEFSDLGSGFQISMKDLDIRGAGNLLGGEQSGFINEMGFDTYMKILNEAVEELKEKNELFIKDDETVNDGENKSVFSKSFLKETLIDTDLPLLIPETYIENLTERLILYRTLDSIMNTEELDKFQNNLVDRFGKIPNETIELIKVVKLRWVAMSLGFEKVNLRNGKMQCYFLSKQTSPYYNSQVFTGILSYIQARPQFATLTEKQGKLWITFELVKNITDAINKLESILKDIEV